MNKRGKANVSDADSRQSRVRNLRRNKIIITKYKKPLKSEEPKPATEETNKVNGEFSSENKNKENDVIEVEDDVQPKEVNSLKNAKGKKRKISVAREDDEVIFLEDSTTNEKVDEENVSEKESSIEFKGFKKRMLSQTEQIKDTNSEMSGEIKNGSTEGTVLEMESSNRKPKIVKINRAKKRKTRGGKKRAGGEDDTQQESQAEYAQYLGLQPTMQFKCYRCGERGFPSMLALNMHQRSCGISSKGNLIANLQQDSSSSDPNMLTNFRITRKVYLCSACGTYYENWNLFLHMRDVHKKHICLFCLTMFGMAEKLADHLKNTHTILESTFKSSEEFQSIYKGSCYLICCTCENMFNERGDYFHHQCVKRDPTAKCNLCGVKCGHYYTCPNSNQPRTLPAVTQPATALKTQVLSVSKPPAGISKNKLSEELWMGNKESSFHDDDYDISHAASFCHVDIDDESGEKNKSGTKENPVDISDDENQNLKSRETKSNRKEPVKKDEKNAKNKIKIPDCESAKYKIKSALENILSKTTPEKDKNGKKTKRKSSESLEQSTDEYKSNLFDTEDIEDVIGVKQTEEPLLKVNVHLDGEKEQLENKCVDEVPTKNDNPPDISSKEQNADQEKVKDFETESEEQNADHEKVQDSKSGREDQNADHEKVQDSKSGSEEPITSPHKDNDANASDSDNERETLLSGGQDDSELSSDDDNMTKKTLNKQTVDNMQDVINKSDNNESSLATHEESNDLQNNSKDSNESSKENESKNDYEEELSSPTFDETNKVLNLDDVIGVNKSVENGEQDKSSDLISLEQSQTEPEEINDGITLAGEEVPAMALTLEDKLDEASSQSVVKECVRTSCLNCVYCSHAIKIAVNGRQLALHLLAEHRYKPVKNNETSQDVVNKLKGSLNDLESIFFNTESYDSSDKSLNTPYDYSYECFQCRYVTKMHKELYVHKRKMHQKTVLLCVMCKSNFYSYSELLCHMCPGIYASEKINFRCLFCNLDMIPSAFRLMVHLRKGHHTCDICLDIAGDQQKLSTHMWKHKLNHLCYRCGIAYRNKPDITKHLFWKHGTESVLCKKCLQKKWPHVYHFCIPPTVFICEECNASFTKAVALKVHKRFHSGEFPYACDKCDQHFVSRKLQKKHELSHNQPPPRENIANKIHVDSKVSECAEDHINVESLDEPVVGKIDSNSKENEDKLESVPELKTKKKKRKDKDRKGKAVLDVYDLPPLNLSSESDSSDEESRLTTSDIIKENFDSLETTTSQPQEDKSNKKAEANVTDPAEENQLPAPIVDGVWDNFHSYKAELEKRESKDLSLPNILPSTSSTDPVNSISEVLSQPEMQQKNEPVNDWTQIDHNYCLVPGKPKPHSNEEGQLSCSLPVEASTDVAQEIPAPRGHSSSIDHAYATLNNTSGDNATSTEEPPSLDEPPTTPQAVPPTESQPTNKKKLKTPKKKKHDTSTHDSSIGNHSSTSSDSSSDSDSSCSCVSNCSCSDSSSSSSTSSSSGSDSSTSEGRRRAAARREKKKERLKHKNHKEDSISAPKVVPTPLPEEEPIVDIPVEPVEVPIRESDLDTDVSSTDEDFYDKYPQSHAKELPIKRDLMLLASVAPVNNGTVSPPPPPPPPVEKSPQTPSKKRKVKTKKRRKSQLSKKAGSKTLLSQQQTQEKASTSLNFPVASSSPSQMTNYHIVTSKVASPLRTPASTFPSDTAGSGSENESARSSKRKRVRNKFYGYSSDEEFQEKQNLKWKKGETNIQPFTPPATVPSYQPSNTHKSQVTIVPPTRSPKSSESSGTDDEPRLRIKKSDSSNSSSSESESEFDSKANIQKDQQTEKSDNLYCYCQCPYDEVSEMIACDGQDCTIEWFHFECVGIMVPPKGKWYCPDCRKRRDLMKSTKAQCVQRCQEGLTAAIDNCQKFIHCLQANHRQCGQTWCRSSQGVCKEVLSLDSF